MKALEKAIVKADGNLAAAARALGVCRQAVSERVNGSPRLKQLVIDARETLKDDAETALRRGVNKDEAWAVCFTLKTIGKDRGYVERQEVEHSGGLSVEIAEELVDADEDAPGDVPPAPGPAGVPPQ